MEIVRTIAETRNLLNRFRSSGSLGLVPTMGYLHEGHMSLISKSVEECDYTAVSIFVNPTQFGPNEDLDKYPRDEEGDLQKCEEAGVDVVFMPRVAEMYPADATVYVNEDAISKVLCGAERPAHFSGVLTVCAKLFNIVGPDAAYFGAKDFQQALLIKRMVRDLNFPLKIKVLPTFREPDGLAMSSRNKYLTDEERKQAVVLNQSLKLAEVAYASGERSVERIKSAVREHIGTATLGEISYVEILDAGDLKGIERIDKPAVLALAVKFSKARLIDNTVLGE